MNSSLANSPLSTPSGGDIYHTHRMLKEKKISSVELTQQSLKNLKSSNSGAFITICEDMALKNAAKADQSFSGANYLQGIPYSLKDLFITKGLRTTASSVGLTNYIPPYQGHVAEQLESSGGVLVGKVACDEFGMGSTNENSAFGKVLNPVHSDYVPGGSSGGSAASVKEGSSYFSIGTDTGGSSRLPAHFCGLVGFKPSYGRISRYGQIAYASSLDQAAPMANTVLDTAIVMSVLSQKDQRDSTQVPHSHFDIVQNLVKTNKDQLRGVKIGYMPELLEGCDKTVAAPIHSLMQELKNVGVQFIEISIPSIKYSTAAYYIIAMCEASSNLARFDGVHYGLRFHDESFKELEETYSLTRSLSLGSEVKKRIMLGNYALSAGHYEAFYHKANQVRALIHRDFQKAFAGCESIMMPVCATRAYKFGEMLKDPVQAYLNDIFTVPANLIGSPAISLPLERGQAKHLTSQAHKNLSTLPTGVQFIGKYFDDERFLTLAKAIEEVIDC